MWAAVVVLGLSAGGLLLSLAGPFYSNPPRGVAATLADGRLVVLGDDDLNPARAPYWQWDGPSAPLWAWPTGNRLGGLGYTSGSLWGLFIPLWLPAAASALVLGGVFITRKRSDKPSASHSCPTCYYDLTGVDGVCPECGSER